jgi:hypothetical protein
MNRKKIKIIQNKEEFFISVETFMQLKHMVDDGINPHIISRYTKIPVDHVMTFIKNPITEFSSYSVL